MGMFGLNIKAKAGGSWQTVKPYVKVGGAWVAARIAWVKAAGNWKKAYEYEWLYTLPTGEINDFDIDTIAGIDKYHSVTITIPSGTTLVASSTSTYALRTGSGYGGTLKIINNGKILGRGGNGGNGGTNSVNGAAGGNGGAAIYIEAPVTIDNNGILAGGGGGGGGGGGAFEDRSWPSDNDYAGGGGGGGGVPYGTGGAGGNVPYSDGAAGTAAVLLVAGSGGSGGQDGYAYGGAGGNGGIYGANGQAGVNGQHTGGDGHDSDGGAGGVVGATYYNPNSYTVTQV